MIDEITRLRAADAGLPAAESYPDPPLRSFPLRLDWEMTLPVAREPYPAPAVSSRDGMQPASWPGPVLTMQAHAEAASWTVRRQYSRGRAPHGSTGRPLAEKGWYGLRMTCGARSAWLVHDGAKWDSMAMWAPEVAAVSGPLLVAWMNAWIRGVDDPPAFMAGVRALLAAAAVRKREQAASRSASTASHAN